MNTTLNEQIQEIQKARMLVIQEATRPSTRIDMKLAYDQMNAGLNDAGSTIAALKMTLEAYKVYKGTSSAAADHCAILAKDFFEQLINYKP